MDYYCGDIYRTHRIVHIVHILEVQSPPFESSTLTKQRHIPNIFPGKSNEDIRL